MDALCTSVQRPGSCSGCSATFGSPPVHSTARSHLLPIPSCTLGHPLPTKAELLHLLAVSSYPAPFLLTPPSLPSAASTCHHRDFGSPLTRPGPPPDIPRALHTPSLACHLMQLPANSSATAANAHEPMNPFHKTIAKQPSSQARTDHHRHSLRNSSTPGARANTHLYSQTFGALSRAPPACQATSPKFACCKLPQRR